MLDPAFVRDNIETVRLKMRQRGAQLDPTLDELSTLDLKRRQLIPEVEGLKRQQNTAGDEVAKAKRQGQDPKHLFEASRARGQQIKQLEVSLAELDENRTGILLTLPNLPHETVPVGAHAADNREVRRYKDPHSFDFTPKSHVELGAALGIIDFERATRMSGARFAVLMGAGARLAAHWSTSCWICIRASMLMSKSTRRTSSTPPR
jgi:seryl-tRNA synthetase